MLTHDELCLTLKNRAQWTSKNIGDGLSTRLGLLEETITDVNLLEIAKVHQDYVITKKFTRRQEGSQSGADWLWCVGEPGSWLILLVQAKIVNPATGNCQSLNYRKGEQCSLLVAYARKIRAVPLYVIYSHIPSGYQPPPKASPKFGDIDSEYWGCAWLTPKTVKALNRNKHKKLELILAESIPWSLPFSSATKYENMAFGEQIAAGFSDSFKLLVDDHLVAKPEVKTKVGPKTKKKRIQWDRVDPTTVLCGEDFPRVVDNILSLGRHGLAPVAGVSIVSAKSLVGVGSVKAISREVRIPTIYNPLVQQSFRQNK